MATVGRKKRKRLPGAGSAVKVKPHTRSPRGPNKGKRIVRVDPYKRGKPKVEKMASGTDRRKKKKRKKKT